VDRPAINPPSSFLPSDGDEGFLPSPAAGESLGEGMESR
jgi:hypothetical protein